jgi:SNF family Na+-dependent transporter
LNLFLLIALLIGTQIGLSDVLILPTLAVEHGEGSFLAAYAFFKVFFILPVLQAELVAGRLYRTTPYEFSFVIGKRIWARALFYILMLALILTLATNLFNTSWALIFGLDGLNGDLLLLRPLDQNLYWFEQSQNTYRIMSFVIAQGIFLMILGGLAWRGIASIFLIMLPVVAVFILWRLPDTVTMLGTMSWSMISFEDLMAAMQHALTSSMAGLFIWYVLGTKVSDQIPTGRVIITVQLVDVLLGMAMLSISWDWISAYGVEVTEAGTVLRALTASLESLPVLQTEMASWLVGLTIIGILSSLPLLLLVAQQIHVVHNPWLLGITVMLVVVTSGGLVLSHDAFSPVTWYDKTLYVVVQQLGQGILVPLLSASICIWIGWVVWPNRVLRQINPHGGLRYFLWRLVLRFVVPMVLGLVFVRATASLIPLNYSLLAIWMVVLLIMIRLFRLLKSRAVLPEI